jgi:hypothetical protein
MTAAALTPSIIYIENGVTVAFAVPFRFRSPQHIAASRVSAAGVVTALAYGADYSVIGGSTDAGGTLTVVAAAVAGTKLRIKRVTPRAQTMDYTTGDTFPAESHETALDTAMLIDQEQDQKIDDIAARALMVPDAQVAPAMDLSGLIEGDIIQYRGGKLRRFVREIFAGKFFAGDATGAPVPASGLGADAALRSDLANNLMGTLLVVWKATGTGGVIRTLWAKLNDLPLSITDFGAVANDNLFDNTAAIQAAIDARGYAYPIKIPAAEKSYMWSDTLLAKRSGVHLTGDGYGVSRLRYSNPAGGTGFSGDAAKNNSLNSYFNCTFTNFTIERSDAHLGFSPLNDPSIAFDITSFTNSIFDIEIQTTRAGARCFYGQGNNGQSPYGNTIRSQGLFGGSDRTQIGIEFAPGAWAGGSNGPNANKVTDIARAASLAVFGKITSGQGNFFTQINAESIKDNLFVLGGTAAVSSGTSSGANNAVVLKDSTKAWAANDFVGGAVQITSGVGAGQIRRIGSNSATQLNLKMPWAIIPDATSQYSIYQLRVSNNKFDHIRQEGSGTCTTFFAWPDSDATEVDAKSIQSVGAYLDDRSCSPDNKFFGQSRSIIRHVFENPGPSASINAFIRAGALGGIKIPGQIVVEAVLAECTEVNHGSTATVTVDCGGGALGGGSPSLVLEIPDTQTTATAFPSLAREVKDGVNNGIYLHLATAPGFSATADIPVTIVIAMPTA